MTSARSRALVLFAAVAVLATALAFSASRSRMEPRARQRPVLLLLTSLPLIFYEGFSIEGSGSPALKRLGDEYRVLPISVTDAQDLSKGRLLLLAQPLAQTPENLVTLDQWVRRGGRVLLLADPLLEWSSSRPLGDPLRPPPMFTDTGLLGHWGLRLDAPSEPGPQGRRLGGLTVVTVSPGELVGSCPISSDRFVARCKLGEGYATVVADADFLNAGALGTAAVGNLDSLIEELAQLERK